MKKLLAVVVVAAAGYAAWRKITDANINQRLWSEVTDAVRNQ